MLQVNVGKLVYPDYEIATTQPLFKDVDAFERCMCKACPYCVQCALLTCSSV